MNYSNASCCAACGKGGNELKTCTACKLITYCSMTCQNDHHPKHKKECKKRAAELFDEALFKQPPPRDECPICFLPVPLPGGAQGLTYRLCCGKDICDGCTHSSLVATNFNLSCPCPFCRAPPLVGVMETLKSRAEGKDAIATYLLGCQYHDGANGATQDPTKALELWLRAVKLGSNDASFTLAAMYDEGRNVKTNKKKAKHYYEIAAMGGHAQSRSNLANLESRDSNNNRAIKHWMIAAAAGHNASLEPIRKGYQHGLVTKEKYETTLRAYKQSIDEVKSEQRDRAAASYAKLVY